MGHLARMQTLLYRSKVFKPFYCGGYDGYDGYDIAVAVGDGDNNCNGDEHTCNTLCDVDIVVMVK